MNLNWAATELQAPSPLTGFQSPPSPASSGDWKMMAPGIGKMMKNLGLKNAKDLKRMLSIPPIFWDKATSALRRSDSLKRMLDQHRSAKRLSQGQNPTASHGFFYVFLMGRIESTRKAAFFLADQSRISSD
jgi:hypothetical protein